MRPESIANTAAVLRLTRIVFRRDGRQGQRVHAGGEFLRQGFVDEALPGNPVQASESSCGDRHVEMRLASGPGAGMSSMAMRFVDHDQAGRRETFCQLRSNYIRDTHS